MQLFSRLFYLALIQAMGLSYAVAAKPVVAQSCPYKSYIIINGKCREFSSIPQVKQPKIETTQESESTFDNYTSYDPNAKTCSDFDYHHEAQKYHDRNPESNLDRDEDGIACEYSFSNKFGYLSRQKYEAVKHEYYRRKQAQTFGFRDNIGMSIAEVQSIIGFQGEYIGNDTWIWANILDPKEEIKVKVLANQIVRLSKKGFWVVDNGLPT